MGVRVLKVIARDQCIGCYSCMQKKYKRAGETLPRICRNMIQSK